jgi:hypothetical protein
LIGGTPPRRGAQAGPPARLSGGGRTPEGLSIGKAQARSQAEFKMAGGAWRRLAGLLVFVMVFAASCHAIGVNGAEAGGSSQGTGSGPKPNGELGGESGGDANGGSRPDATRGPGSGPSPDPDPDPGPGHDLGPAREAAR